MKKSIGQRIKDRRKELNLTLAQIQKSTGISTGNLSDIENGKSLPSAISIIELSKILECTTDYILLGKTLTSGNKYFSNTQANELLSCFESMSESDRDELLMIAQYKMNKVFDNKKEDI